MRRALAALLLLGSASLAAAGVAAGDGGPAGDAAFVDSAQVQGKADFTNEPAGTIAPSATSVPRWSGSFRSGGATYPFTMVGTDPAGAPTPTAVKTVIVPIDLRFRSGLGGVLRGSDRVPAILASPIFRPTDFSVLRNTYVPGYGALGDQGGPPVVTQYGDAVQKAMFWQTGGSNAGYHVTLAAPTVYPAQQVEVPAPQGYDLVGAISKRHYALVDDAWFANRVHNLLVSLKIPPDVAALFVTDSAFLYIGSPSVCCIIGYHGATTSAAGNGKQQVNTYVYASYSDQGIFVSPKLADVHALSHEVSEWYADPFVNNAVPSWSAPTAPFYGCVSALETGDPVVGHGFDATPVGGTTTYHPEDEVFYSWFAREQPSRGYAGRYTLMQNPWFTGVSQPC
jgi:hypothetical protein